MEADPREVAHLLGHLVFVAQCVSGGRAYMSGILSQFRGLEVDWRRGQVRAKDGEWQRVVLTSGFWRDLNWWARMLPMKHFVEASEVETWGGGQRTGVGSALRWAADTVIAGTDASGWGMGQLCWLDGQRSECSLECTAADRRRPINWRERLGILRVVEMFGEQARGRELLVETDNMTARGAAEKLASRSADMQELLRRLLEKCERYEIVLRVVHTPGAMLLRPDQTSRGLPVKEPRVRLTRDEFGVRQAGWGPFDQLMDAERQHSGESEGTGGVGMHQRRQRHAAPRYQWGHETEEPGLARVRAGCSCTRPLRRWARRCGCLGNGWQRPTGQDYVASSRCRWLRGRSGGNW